MTSHTLLLLDPNPQTLKVMESQLRGYGYQVSATTQVAEALELIEAEAPDLIISELELGRVESALDLFERLKADASTREISLITLTDHESRRIECLTAGADDVLVKPVYMAELRDRVEQLLQRKSVNLQPDSSQRFFGRLEEMGLLDLLQVIDVSKRSGLLLIEHKSERGSLWFQEGILHDAEMNRLRGRAALNRLLTWEFGQYEFDFNAAARPDQIQSSLEEIKAAGLKYVSQWNKVCELLPSLDTIFRYDPSALAERSEPLSSISKKLIERFNGQRTILETLNVTEAPDLDVLQAITELYFEGLVYEVREVFDGEGESEEVFIDAPGTLVPPIPGATGAVEPPPAPYLDLEGGLSEEGEDLLADMYSTPGGEAEPQPDSVITPPPIPDEFPEDDEQADETYSTLFGIDGSFDYADEEAEFFEQLESAEERPAISDIAPPARRTHPLTWLFSLSIVGLGVAFFSQDHVNPLEITEYANDYRQWTKIALGERPADYERRPIKMPWQIKVRSMRAGSNLDGKGDEQSGSVVIKPKTRKLKRSEQRQLAKTLKEAIALRAQATDANQRKQALKVTQKALSIQPSDPSALLLAASLCLDNNESEQALHYLLQLWQVDPQYNNPSALGSDYGPGIVYILIGTTLQMLKRDQEAVTYYEDYIRAFPSSAQSREIRSIINRIRRKRKR